DAGAAVVRPDRLHDRLVARLLDVQLVKAIVLQHRHRQRRRSRHAQPIEIHRRPVGHPAHFDRAAQRRQRHVEPLPLPLPPPSAAPRRRSTSACPSARSRTVCPPGPSPRSASGVRSPIRCPSTSSWASAGVLLTSTSVETSPARRTYTPTA